MEGGLVFTKYASGCLRHILLKHHGVKEEINVDHKERGALNEELFAERFKDVPVARERPFRIDLLDDPYAVVSGRIDYLAYPDDPQRKVIKELKSTESASVKKSTIDKGQLSPQVIAQTVWYMLAERCNNADLIQTHYKRDKKTKVLKPNAERSFSIAVDDCGKIMVDNADTGFKVSNVIQHATEAIKGIAEGRLSGRPYSPSSYENPCRFCPFNRVCDYYDSGIISSTDDFVRYSQQVLAEKSFKDQAAAFNESEKSE